MRHSYFDITNFKGITHIHLDFDSQPRSKVYTLVGLNESGKTTILEALNFLSYKSESLDPLNLPGYSIHDVHELIPISKRSNFNEMITIEAGFELDEDDEHKIKEFVQKTFGLEMSEPIKKFSIKQSYRFIDSQLAPQKKKFVWNILFSGKRKGSRKLVELSHEEWVKAIDFVRTLLPSILYFPNFLFEFPDKIYLEDAPGDLTKHAFYRTILQDVLDAIDEDIHLHKHVIERAKSGERSAKQALESVLLKMGSNITRTVFQNWNRIFNRTIGKKEIMVSVEKDDEERLFLQLRLKDANELYSISERSLGFRWFFAFLLLTQYRGFRKSAPKNVLFLFDEPASNLHSSAQSQLLASFGNFPSGCSIIYTTHSHHMINPDWLEGTFVVRNEGLDYDAEDDYNARNTVITLDKYRHFAGQHPHKTTYFQPVLDVLDYSPGKLENVPNVVMVEGKNDFYTLKYFQDTLLRTPKKLNLLPGSGAGQLDDVIRLYLGWGRDFIILLDSDTAGLEEKRRYERTFGALLRNRIFTLEDVDVSWKKKGMEFLLDEQDRLVIQHAAYPDALKFNKTQFNRSIQELYLVDKSVSISVQTLARFEKILAFCESKLHT